MNWYKLASINPWSIFDKIHLDGDRDLEGGTISMERLSAFISDASNRSLTFENAYIVPDKSNEVMIKYGAEPEVIFSDNNPEVIREKIRGGLQSVIKALESMDLFFQVHSYDENLELGNEGLIKLVCYGVIYLS
jgi:hypothetical protein